MKKYLTKENQELLDLYEQDGLYNPDYIHYDAMGHHSTNCMRCGTLVIERDSEAVNCPHCGRVVSIERSIMRELPNFIRVLMKLEDGSQIGLISCLDCQHLISNASEQEQKRIIAQINYGYARSMGVVKRPEKDIQDYVDRMQKIKFKKLQEAKSMSNSEKIKKGG